MSAFGQEPLSDFRGRIAKMNFARFGVDANRLPDAIIYIVVFLILLPEIPRPLRVGFCPSVSGHRITSGARIVLQSAAGRTD
jgi:hypothetical protein